MTDEQRMAAAASLAYRIYTATQHDCTEIGLRTYGRRGNDLVQTQDWQKLQLAEKWVRELRGKVMADASEIYNLLHPETKGRVI